MHRKERLPVKVLVSACLLGENCKYNGKNNRNETLIQRLQSHELVPICPEVLAGLGVPRPCVELRAGVAYNQYGEKVDDAFRAGVARALAQIEGQTIDLVILQSRSPTCGVKQIYDGSFRKQLIDGQGMLAAALLARGYRVVDVEDIDSVPEL